MPHGHCYFWRADILWLNVLSDLVIALAYFMIPVILIYFVWKRKDLPFPWMFSLFGAFIVLCGMTHMMDVYTTWWPVYRVQGLVKLMTAIVSIVTAGMLIPLIPKALSLRSPGELEELNGRLNTEIVERKKAEESLRLSNEQLSKRAEELKAQRLAALNLAQDAEEAKKRAERTEQASRRLAAIVESSDDAILDYTLDGMITSWNKGAERLYGYPASEAIGKPIALLIPPDRTDEVPKLLGRLQQEEWVQHYETQRQRKDGTRVEISLSVSLIKDPSGRIVGVSAIARDITERQQAEEALRESMKQLAGQKQALDQFAIVAETDPQGRITYANDQFCTIAKYTREELIGKDHREVVNSGYHSKEFWKEMWATIGQGKIWRGDVRNRAKDGTIYWVDTTIVPFVGPDGKPEKYLAIRAVITERKWAEAEIAAKSKELETLLYVTSHDLTEPLRSIENFSRIALDEHGERLDEEGQDLLRRVVKGGARMHLLLNDILTFSRVRRMTPPTEEVPGEAIIREALDGLAARIQETNAKVQVAKDLPPLRTDRTWATQAVYNLVSNALKFTRPGASPDVEIAAYRPAPGDPDGEGFVVRDRGPGVAPEHAERIFNLFERAVGHEVEGTGAGLAIVRAVAERHGGTTWVRPREGGGSEFIVTFGKNRG